MSEFNPSNPSLLKSSKTAATTTTEDELLTQDLPGNKKPKRNELRLNYDSDSAVSNSDNEEDEKEEDATKEKNDSDDDMFASGDEEEKPQEKTKPKYLDMDKFAKEEGLDNIEIGDDEESDAEEDEDDEDEEVKPNVEYYINPESYEPEKSAGKLKEPTFDAFNLKEESKSGKFDLSGNYIREEDASDEEDVPEDEWLNNVNKSEIRKAKKAQAERENFLQMESQSEILSSKITEDILAEMIELLEPAESPIEALQRLNANNQHKRRGRKQALSDEEKQKANEITKLVNKITELCDQLTNKNIKDVYNITREELMRKYKYETGEEYKHNKTLKRTRSESDLNEDKSSEKSDVYYNDKIWEFQWIGQEEVHGPYTSYEMEHWSETYFENNVKVKKITETGFKDLNEVVFE